MNKLLLLLLVVSPSLFAQPDSTTPVLATRVVKEKKKFVARENHTNVSFGFESLSYEAPIEFTGDKRRFQPSKKALFGGRLGVAKEFYLGGGMNTTTRLEGYYVGTLFAKRLNAGPEDTDEEFSYSKRTGQVYGADISQSIGFLFDMKTKNPFMEEWTVLTVEPYVEFGAGYAAAYNRQFYNYDTGPTNTQEQYRFRMRDEIVNTKLGVGVNFTDNQGYFLYIKATANNYSVMKRRVEEYKQPHGTTASINDRTQSNVNIDTVFTYAIGGGLKF